MKNRTNAVAPGLHRLGDFLGKKSVALRLVVLASSSSSRHSIVDAIGFKTKNAKSEDSSNSRAPWQACEVFMAPTNTTTGWGVFANRDFDERELVDITPLHFYMKTKDESSPTEHRLIKSTSLDDYVYGAHYAHLNKHESNILFGYEMIYNHHPTDSNIVLALSTDGYVHGFYTKRPIRAGEEILSSYTTSSDAGKAWFEARNMNMSHDKAVIVSPEQQEFLSSQYCTKIYAGAGPETFQRLFPSIDESRVAPFEAGLNDARAKFPIQAGERIEQAPAILLYKPFVKGTALAPLVITWEDMLFEHQDIMISASGPIGGKLPIEYSGPGSQWQRIRRMTNLENVAILPFAGRIGMVKRVDTRASFVSGVSSNCRLEIRITVHEAFEHEQNDKPRVSVVLELVATEDIPTGEVLLLDLKPAGTEYERELLKAKLKDIGHPFKLD